MRAQKNKDVRSFCIAILLRSALNFYGFPVFCIDWGSRCCDLHWFSVILYKYAIDILVGWVGHLRTPKTNETYPVKDFQRLPRLLKL